MSPGGQGNHGAFPALLPEDLPPPIDRRPLKESQDFYSQDAGQGLQVSDTLRIQGPNYFHYFFSTPLAYGSSQARDQI